jgi:hypothetical protein
MMQGKANVDSDTDRADIEAQIPALNLFICFPFPVTQFEHSIFSSFALDSVRILSQSIEFCLAFQM